MKKLLYIKLSLGFILSPFLLSCEDFLEIDAPQHKIVNEVVFNSNETALSAMTGIYHHLFNASYINGSANSVTGLGGLSADNLNRLNNELDFLEFEQNEISPLNSKILIFWSSAYNIIYMCNSLLEGVDSSTGITDQLQEVLEGEAKFIRAFTYFHLINLFGEVPLLLTTDYQYNSLATRVDQQEIYEYILADLTDATNLLEDEYRDGDRKHVNRFAAISLLARVNLYLENWEEAERLSTLVLNNTSSYELKKDLDLTFLANSQEAIWQISPMGQGTNTNTNEGMMYLNHPTFSFLSASFELPDDLVNSYEVNDKRKSNWIGYDEGAKNHFVNKYKIKMGGATITEYSMVLRLAEQYFIRAEAKTRQGNISEAIKDIDIIRERAGVSLLSEENLNLEEEEFLKIILEERRKELFAERGHRWLDLKRTGMANEVLSAKKPSWETTDVFYPIPEAERIKNPNLSQNPGY